MKGIKWKHYVGFVLVLVLCFLLNFGLVKNTNAAATTTYISSATIDRNYALGTDIYVNSITCSSFPCQVIGVGQGRFLFGFRFAPFTNQISNTYGANGYYSYTLAFTVDRGQYSWAPVGAAAIPVVSSDSNATCSVGGQSSSTAWWYKCSGTGQGNIPAINIRFGVMDASYAYLSTDATSGNGVRIITPNISYEFTREESAALLEYQNGLIAEQNELIEDTNDLLQEQNDRDEQDRENIESQQEDTNSSAEESSEDLEQGTTNLIGALSSFFSAMSNVSAGSCTLPEITAYGMSLGQLNLCTYSPPAWIQTALSVIISIIAIRLAYSIFKRIIKIVKSFTGGNG